MHDLLPVDFTVLVAMGKSESGATDRFFVMPTRKVREALEAARYAFYKRPRRDGRPRVETGQITLWLRPLKNGEDDPQHGFEQTWKCYLDGWGSLTVTRPTQDELHAGDAIAASESTSRKRRSVIDALKSPIRVA